MRKYSIIEKQGVFVSTREDQEEEDLSSDTKRCRSKEENEGEGGVTIKNA